jgi:hypothetical protein
MGGRAKEPDTRNRIVPPGAPLGPYKSAFLFPGLAWRAWLFVTVLPSFLTLWQGRRP